MSKICGGGDHDNREAIDEMIEDPEVPHRHKVEADGPNSHPDPRQRSTDVHEFFGPENQDESYGGENMGTIDDLEGHFDDLRDAGMDAADAYEATLDRAVNLYKQQKANYQETVEAVRDLNQYASDAVSDLQTEAAAAEAKVDGIEDTLYEVESDLTSMHNELHN